MTVDSDLSPRTRDRVAPGIDIDIEQTHTPPMTRRGFLSRVGLGVATVFVVADGVVSYRGWDQGVMTEGKGPAFDALAEWDAFTGPEAVVAAAVLAANAHNTQPWAFAINGQQIELFADLTRSTGANDPQHRELYVSLGCALENLVLAAAANGYRADVVVNAADGDDLVATIELEPAPPVADELYLAIPNRRSNRSDYKDSVADPTAMTAMSALADEVVDPARLVWVDSDNARRQFSELLVQATEAHSDDEQASQDSFAWWRSDWDQVQRHKDGLTIDGVGLSPLVRTLGKILPASSRAAADDTFVERTLVQAESAAAFGLITVTDPTARDQQLAGGRYLQRLHLWATAHDIGFQHMNQITERIDRDRQQGIVSSFEEPLNNMAGQQVLVAFRIGTPTVASMKSPRRPLEEVLR